MVVDTIVIGAGAMGSAAAYWLSKYQDVALIEQFEFLHHNGSSHGQSRIIRKTYAEPHFANMMPEAYKLWNSIQQETGQSVYTKTGGLNFGSQSSQNMKDTEKVCESSGLEYEVLDAKEIMTKYPAYSIEDDYYGIYQPETGILNATKSVNMLQQQAQRQGAQLLGNHRVSNIYPKQDKVVVETNNGSFTAKNVVITTGSWMSNILQQFDIKLQTEVWRMTFAYWKAENPDLFKADKFPVFIHWNDEPDYGFPIHERQGYVKIAPHINELVKKTSLNDGINEINQELLDHLAQFISNTFNGLSTKPEYAETCLYTMTPDENFILDQLPNHENIVVAGGFSGHGFKFTPLIGRIIQQVVMNEEIEFDLSHFQLSNFLV